MMERPLDPGYAAAARAPSCRPAFGRHRHAHPVLRRGRAADRPAAQPWRALAARSPTRQRLAGQGRISFDQIEARRADADARTRQAQPLAGRDRPRAGRRPRWPARRPWPNASPRSTLVAGSRRVTGPGLRLTLDDAAGHAHGREPTATRAAARVRRGPGDRPRTCRSSSTACGRPAPRRSPSTASGSRPRSAIRFAGQAHPRRLPAADPALRHHAPSATPGRCQVEFADERRRHLRCVALEDNFGVRVDIAGGRRAHRARRVGPHGAQRGAGQRRHATGTPSTTGTRQHRRPTPTTTESSP